MRANCKHLMLLYCIVLLWNVSVYYIGVYTVSVIVAHSYLQYQHAYNSVHLYSMRVIVGIAHHRTRTVYTNMLVCPAKRLLYTRHANMLRSLHCQCWLIQPEPFSSSLSSLLVSLLLYLFLCKVLFAIVIVNLLIIREEGERLVRCSILVRDWLS